MSEDKAITTGAPVATNDKQAAELTQKAATTDERKWGVWSFPDNDWCHTEDGCVFTADEAYQIYKARRSSREIRKYPEPGEWVGKGGYLWEGNRHVAHVYLSDAPRIAARLNAADAMEQALTRIALVSNDRVVQELASAALRK